jgi:FkbM family methyltransferase
MSRIAIAAGEEASSAAPPMHPLNRALRLLGLRLSKIPAPTPPEPANEEEGGETPRWLRFGQVEILVPAGNLMYECYQHLPDYTAELGRLAAAIYSKYPDMRVVDVGANVGDTAAIVRKTCPAPILCIEGDPKLLDALTENAGRIGDTEVVARYLSDATEEKTVIIDKHGWNSTLLPSGPDTGGDTVRFATLDEVLSDSDWHPVKLLKIDTEGFDGKILRGAPGLLGKDRPMVQFEYNRVNLNALGEDGPGIFRHLRGFGYSGVLIWDSAGRFLCGTSLDRMDLLEDLHDYIDATDKSLSPIAYYDVGVFHEDDADLAAHCLDIERRVRHKSRETPA